MERIAFSLLKHMESSWWYRGRSFAIRSALAHAGVKKADTALDFGAGFGGASSLFAAIAERTDAFEPDEEAAKSARERGYYVVIKTEEEALSRQYDRIGVFDVLEHIEDDVGFLKRALPALLPEGRMVITVPAYQSLWSAHDIEHHHYRRYSRSQLVRLFKGAGYEIEYAGHWNMSLLPVAALMRALGLSGEGGLAPNSIVNSVLTIVVRIEALCMRFLPLPFGLSLVAIARPASSAPASSIYKKLWFLGRYGIAGALGAIIQVTTLYVWVDVLGFTAWYLVGVVVGFILALTATFLLQKFWTFRDAEQSRAPVQLFSYTLVALSGLSLNASLLYTAHQLFEAQSINFFDGWYLVTQVVVVILVSAFNLAMNLLITFRHARRDGSWKR